MSSRIYNVVKDDPDSRDLLFTLVEPVTQLPSIIDFRAVCPPIYDQGDLGSCTR